MAVESVNFDCAVHGYHVYKNVWEPKERQVLSCLHEENNIHVVFFIRNQFIRNLELGILK